LGFAFAALENAVSAADWVAKGTVTSQSSSYATTVSSASSVPSSGGQLNWLPYAPEKPKADPAIQQVQYNAPTRRNAPTPAVRPSPESASPPSRLSDDAADRGQPLTPAPASEVDSSPTIPAEPSQEAASDSSMPDEPLQFPTEDAPPAKPARPRQLAVDAPTKTPAKTSSQQTKPTPNDYYDSRDRGLPDGARDWNGKETGGDHYCRSIKEMAKPINEIAAEIQSMQGKLPQDCPWGENEKFMGRSWRPLTYTWTASALCHKPLYFEDEHLERYGHMLGPWLQPIASHARFFATVPLLPYEMGLEPPHECIYALGHYRPGSCAPYYLDPIPFSARAALFEAGAIVGGIAVIP
jgi:hypothetical protein